MRIVLRLLGVRHQRTAPFAPWQNGRVERLFRTVKRTLRLRARNYGEITIRQDDLDRLRAWCNHLRPRQNLDGLTPAEAWNGTPADRQRRPASYSDWDGLLAGYYWPT